MSKLQLNGKVLYMPGTWGVALPAQNVHVYIVDIDQPGKGDDRIWSGTTDSSGCFQGTSSEWQDSITTTITGPSIWVPDLHGGH